MENDLKLRVLEKDDLEFLHRLFNDPNVMDYWFGEPYMSLEKLKQNYDKRLEDSAFRQFVLEKDNERIGMAGIARIDETHRNAEFAIMIDPRHQGNGYALEATHLTTDYAFKRLNLHKFYLIVDKENKKAIHIYEKAGFRKEGELIEHFFVNGSYHDAISMYMLASEFYKSAGDTN